MKIDKAIGQSESHEPHLHLVKEPESKISTSIESNNFPIVGIGAPAEELPSKLINFLRFVPESNLDSEIENRTKGNLEKIVLLLRQQTGHDFSLYKKNTLFRRIERRKGIHQINKIQNYVRFLQENPKEIEILFNELLIGVTNFFRDKAVWEMLKETVLPGLINKLPNGYVIRVWGLVAQPVKRLILLPLFLKR